MGCGDKLISRKNYGKTTSKIINKLRVVRECGGTKGGGDGKERKEEGV